jgi:integrase
LKYGTRRAITVDEAQRLLDIEPNPEWKAFLQLLWHIGAAQVDMAAMTHENINWPNRTISYTRKKTGTLALQRFGAAVEAILRERPAVGPLFPHFGKQESAARATRFSERCQKLGIVGVSLHSYRYAWAERARQAGIPNASLTKLNVRTNKDSVYGKKSVIESLRNVGLTTTVFKYVSLAILRAAIKRSKSKIH